MKRHLQKTGVRKFFGQDLIDLQAEPLKALDGFFAEYGACVIMGCEITPAENDTFKVAPGLVAIQATDPETDITAIKVMPFNGAAGVVLPLYLTAQSEVVERVYGDGKVKSIAYDYHAVAAGVEPETPHIVLTASGGNRFVDVLQDDSHSFITAQERNKWNAILQSAKEYADAAATAKSEAMLRASKEYIDGKDSAVRRDMATADTATLRSAKDYADTIVAALVDNTPEALNTLQELATALGNNPNFATDVLQAIGERATMAQVNAALEGKANTNHVHANMLEKSTSYGHVDANSVTTTGGFYPSANGPEYPWCNAFSMRAYGAGVIQLVAGMNDSRDYFVRTTLNENDGTWKPWYKLYHDGNLNLADYHKTDVKGWRVERNCDKMTDSGTYDINPSEVPFVNAPFHNYGQIVVFKTRVAIAQIAFQVNSGDMYFRNLYDTSPWSPWRLVYHSGNMQCGVIGGGRVYAGGGSIDYGCIVSVVGTGVQGQYRIVHNLGHTNYSLTGNVFYGSIAAFLMILTYGLNDIVVEVRDVQSHPQRLDFMYTISGRL